MLCFSGTPTVYTVAARMASLRGFGENSAITGASKQTFGTSRPPHESAARYSPFRIICAQVEFRIDGQDRDLDSVSSQPQFTKPGRYFQGPLSKSDCAHIELNMTYDIESVVKRKMYSTCMFP